MRHFSVGEVTCTLDYIDAKQQTNGECEIRKNKTKGAIPQINFFFFASSRGNRERERE